MIGAGNTSSALYSAEHHGCKGLCSQDSKGSYVTGSALHLKPMSGLENMYDLSVSQQSARKRAGLRNLKELVQICFLCRW